MAQLGHGGPFYGLRHDAANAVSAQPFRVIPGRRKAASPESRNKLRARVWIPGTALRAVPE
jgi:hypothetical protein